MLLRVRRERLERSMTIRQVCDQCTVSESVLSNVENGRMIPYDKLRKRLSKFYGVPEGELFLDVDAAQRYLAQVAGKPRVKS